MKSAYGDKIEKHSRELLTTAQRHSVPHTPQSASHPHYDGTWRKTSAKTATHNGTNTQPNTFEKNCEIGIAKSPINFPMNHIALCEASGLPLQQWHIVSGVSPFESCV